MRWHQAPSNFKILLATYIDLILRRRLAIRLLRDHDDEAARVRLLVEIREQRRTGEGNVASPYADHLPNWRES